MKKTALLFFILPIVGFSQDSLYSVLPLENGKVIYTRIIDFPKASKERLYTNIKEWAVKTYKSQKATLETEDKESGFIVYKGYFEGIGKYLAGINKGKTYINKIYHTLKFYVKNEKIKLQLTDIATLGGYDYMLASMTKTLPAPTPIESLGTDLEEQIRRGTISEKKVVRRIEYIKHEAEQLDGQIQLVMISISNELKMNKSEFDF